MATGYNYIQGIGGPGAQQAGGMSPALRMMDATTQQPTLPPRTPGIPGYNPLSTGAYAQTPMTPPFGQATPAQQTALGSNATNVPGFGYINNGWLNGGSLNGLGAGSFTPAQINALNAANGGRQIGQTFAGTGGLGGVQESYGFLPQGTPGYGGNGGADNLGNYFQFGGQNYGASQAGLALQNFNNIVGQFDQNNKSGQDSAYTIPSQYFGVASPGGAATGWQTTLNPASSLQGAYSELAANPQLQYYTATPGLGSFYTDPSYSQYSNSQLHNGGWFTDNTAPMAPR